MAEYVAKVVDTIGEFSKKERIRCKQLSDVAQINEMFGNEDTLIMEGITGMATVEVHNEKSANTDYSVYVLRDLEGSLYSTSSDSLATSFKEVAEETLMEGDESVDIKIIRKPSNNKEANGGKFFTCTIF